MISREVYLRSFDAYRQEVESEGFTIENVEVCAQGLLTWTASGTTGRVGFQRLDEIYDRTFRPIDQAFAEQTLCKQNIGKSDDEP